VKIFEKMKIEDKINTMQNIYNYSLTELRQYLFKEGLPAFCAGQVFDWLYKKRVEDFDGMSNLSKDARCFLKKTFFFGKLACIRRQRSADTTEKYLFRLQDDALIETVLIPEKRRTSVCISTQVGCKFKCSFCASGATGFKRNLETAEIIGQYLWVIDQGKIPTNLVFMGIGEPLDNFDNVIKAVRILIDSKGTGFSKRKICISTAGISEPIKQLLRLDLGIKLSVSLHSADNDIRSKLMPINRKYPLKELIAVLKNSGRIQRYPITFEYALIRGLNTRKKDAVLLSQLLHGITYKINLIPLNQACANYQSPTPEEIAEFTSTLKKKGIVFTIRKPRGQDIDAACGQLRAVLLKEA